MRLAVDTRRNFLKQWRPNNRAKSFDCISDSRAHKRLSVPTSHFIRLASFLGVIVQAVRTSDAEVSSSGKFGWGFLSSGKLPFNPFTPKNDQVQISSAASSVIWRHIVWRTWFFIAYSNRKMNIVTILSTSLIHFSLKGCENVAWDWNNRRGF